MGARTPRGGLLHALECDSCYLLRPSIAGVSRATREAEGGSVLPSFISHFILASVILDSHMRLEDSGSTDSCGEAFVAPWCPSGPSG